MTVSVDGVERYHWPVSTGNPSHETPNGKLPDVPHGGRPFLQGIRRRADAALDLLHQGRPRHPRHFSEGSLGVPVSHGCVRISRANATTLYALVQKEGVLNTTVTLTGSSRVALARNPAASARPMSPAASRHRATRMTLLEIRCDLTPQQIAPVSSRRPWFAATKAISIRRMAAPAIALSRAARLSPPIRRAERSSATQYYGEPSRLWSCAALPAAGLRAAARISRARPVHRIRNELDAGYWSSPSRKRRHTAPRILE